MYGGKKNSYKFQAGVLGSKSKINWQYHNTLVQINNNIEWVHLKRIMIDVEKESKSKLNCEDKLMQLKCAVYKDAGGKVIKCPYNYEWLWGKMSSAYLNINISLQYLSEPNFKFVIFQRIFILLKKDRAYMLLNYKSQQFSPHSIIPIFRIPTTIWNIPEWKNSGCSSHTT